MKQKYEFNICMMLFTIITWSILGVAGMLKCNPEHNEYYHRQAGVCLPCEKCLQGEEPIPLEEWDIHWDPDVGPTECRRCRRCQPGTYSETRSFSCEPCKNCSLYGQYEVTGCTHVHDTVCDGVRPSTASHRSNFKPIQKDKSDGLNDDDNSTLYIVGVICITIFLVILSLMVCYCMKAKLFKTERNENRPLESSQANSAENKNVIIDIPVEVTNEDSQPLLSCTSDNNEARQPLLSYTSDNMSVATESVELDEIEHSGLLSPSTEVPQDLCTDGYRVLPTDQALPTNVRDRDTGHGNSGAEFTETNSADEGTDSSTDSEDTGVDLMTDGATESFSRKIVFERQWSHPFDGRREREYYSRASGEGKLPVVENASKDDLSLVTKSKKKDQAVGEKFLHRAAKYLVTDRLYLDVARECGLEEADIEIIKYDYQNESVQEVSYQMLLKIAKRRNLTQACLKDAVLKYDPQAWENIVKCVDV